MSTKITGIEYALTAGRDFHGVGIKARMIYEARSDGERADLNWLAMLKVVTCIQGDGVGNEIGGRVRRTVTLTPRFTQEERRKARRLSLRNRTTWCEQTEHDNTHHCETQGNKQSHGGAILP